MESWAEAEIRELNATDVIFPAFKVPAKILSFSTTSRLIEAVIPSAFCEIKW